MGGSNMIGREKSPDSLKGGKREGAGRPTLPPSLLKVHSGIRLPGWLLDWIGKQKESGSTIAEKAITEKFEIKRCIWCDEARHIDEFYACENCKHGKPK